MEASNDGTAIDVVVPVHGGWSYVSQCIESLRSQGDGIRIIVVDDKSPDDTADRIAASFPDVTLIRNERNRGFAASCNVGIRAGSAPVVVLLNSDVEASPDFAESIRAAFADCADDVGSIAPVLLRPDGLVDSFGIVADRSAAGYVRYHGASLDVVDPVVPVVLGPYGAAAAYRRSALDEVGLLDENIFMYGEELDLALRLRAGGWGAVGLARVVGTHLGGASAGKGSQRQRYLSGFGRGYILHTYGIMRSRAAVHALVTEAVVTVLRLVRFGDVASLRGRWDGWRAARSVSRRPIPQEGIDKGIGTLKALRMRSATYWHDGGR